MSSPRSAYPRQARIQIAACCCLLLALLLILLPYAAGNWSRSRDDRFSGDRYDASLSGLRTLEELQAALPEYIVDTGHPRRDLALGITALVEHRFVRGSAHQSWRENWIANVLDAVAPAPTSFTLRLDAEDVLNENVASHWQAGLVMPELFKRNGIPFATVSFYHQGRTVHSAVAGNPDGTWRYYDAAMEPREQGVPFDKLLTTPAFLALYSAPPWRQTGTDRLFLGLAERGAVTMTNVNEPAATRGVTVQRVTKLLSERGWMPFLFAGLLLWVVSRRRSLRRRWRALMSRRTAAVNG